MFILNFTIMKKLLLLSLLFLTSFLKGQTAIQAEKIVQKSNVLVLKTISEKARIAFWSNKRKAIEMSKIYNWQLILKDKDVFSELIGVSSTNQPIYYSTYNQGAGVTSRANKLYNNGGLGLNIQGQNMTSGIWDAGAALPTHELFEGRVQVLDMNTQTHPHATHVAGTIMGSNQFQNGLATGMAFMANMNSYDWNEDQSEVATAASNGLLLSNHSYGYSPSFVTDNQWGKYDQTSQTYDEIMFNAPYYQCACAVWNLLKS